MLSALHIHIMAFPQDERFQINHITILLSQIDCLVMDLKADFELKKDVKRRLDGFLAAKQALQRSYLPGIPTREQRLEEEDLKAKIDATYRLLRIPFRDAGMNLDQLSKLVVKTLRAEVKKAATFASAVDLTSLARATACFSKAFADAPDMRNLIAHSAENLATREASAKLSAGGIRGVAIAGGLSGDDYFATIGGKMKMFSLVEGTVQALDEVLSHIGAAFEPTTVRYS
jgi:hypothetical protein